MRDMAAEFLPTAGLKIGHAQDTSTALPSTRRGGLRAGGASSQALTGGREPWSAFVSLGYSHFYGLANRI